MLRAPFRIVIFVSAYAPLLALFAILRSFGRGWPTYLCGAVAVCSAVGLFGVWYLKSSETINDDELITLTETRNRDSDVMAYFVTYVVPFAVVDKPDIRVKVALGVFAVVIAILYLQSSETYVNPLLLIFGFHIYDATTDKGIPVTLLTRKRFLRQKENIRAIAFSPNVFLERQQ